jgi:hypothetical protein
MLGLVDKYFVVFFWICCVIVGVVAVDGLITLDAVEGSGGFHGPFLCSDHLDGVFFMHGELAGEGV